MKGVVLYTSCPREQQTPRRESAGASVPCKLNNEKHEQTPWAIDWKNEVVQMMSVKTEIVRIANVRKFLSKAKSELMNW